MRNAKLREMLDERSEFVTESGCQIWLKSLDPCGYGRMRWQSKEQKAHRLSVLAEGINIPEGSVVMHSCDTPSCINPKHLRVGSQKSNMRDCWAKGRGRKDVFQHMLSIRRSQVGVANIKAKLTEAQVLQIRSSKENGPTLAARYSVTRETIYAIKTRKTWGVSNGLRKPYTPTG